MNAFLSKSLSDNRKSKIQNLKSKEARAMKMFLHTRS